MPLQAWSSGTPVAIQPVGGHLEFVKARLAAGDGHGMDGVGDPLPNISIMYIYIYVYIYVCIYIYINYINYCI